MSSLHLHLWIFALHLVISTAAIQSLSFVVGQAYLEFVFSSLGGDEMKLSIADLPSDLYPNGLVGVERSLALSHFIQASGRVDSLSSHFSTLLGTPPTFGTLSSFSCTLFSFPFYHSHEQISLSHYRLLIHTYHCRPPRILPLSLYCLWVFKKIRLFPEARKRWQAKIRLPFFAISLYASTKERCSHNGSSCLVKKEWSSCTNGSPSRKA